jgi:tagatose 1,6-diphosphate aldolase
MKISIGKLRGLQEIADEGGFLTMCAIDHRGALQRALNEENPASVTYQDMVDFKLDLCQAVRSSVGAVLLDPRYGAAQAIAGAVLLGHVGLMVSLEKTGYSGESTARLSEVLPDWSVRKAKRMGASAVKLLIYFRPDLKDVAEKQLDLVAKLADDCLEEDVPLLVEPVAYPVEADNNQFAAKKPELVIETARQVTELPVDILKAEFPADISYEKDEDKLLDYCQKLDRASKLPWVLLSAGVGFDLFKKQVEIASRAGASGFLAGRALWQEGVKIKSREERMDFFKTTSKSRLDKLAGLVREYGKPWYSRYGSTKGEFESVAENWYADYPER